MALLGPFLWNYNLTNMKSERAIRGKVEEIHEGLQNLKNRTDYNVLRHNDRVWLVEQAIDKYRDHGEEEGLKHALDIFHETAGLATEGEAAYDVTIWDASVQARGKMTTLDGLFGELEDLFFDKQAV